MATSLRELIVSVSADTTKYQREMDRASRMGAQYFRSVQDGGRTATSSWNTQTAAARTHATAIEASTQAISRYVGIAAGAFGVGKLIGLADEWTNISARVRLATESTTEFEKVQDRLRQIADTTYRSYAEAADQFASTAHMMRELGFNTDDALDSAEALGLALVAGGADAQRGASAMSAWTKAIALGRIDTEKWTTLMEQTPRVAQALAEGLGKTTAEMTQMARAGELTADVVVPALISQMGKLRGEVDSMATEVRDATGRFNNALLEWVGRMNEAHDVSGRLVDGIEFLAENIDGMAKLAGGAAIGVLASKMILMAKSTVQAAVGMVQSRAAAVAEAVAIRDATLAGQLKAQADVRRAQAAMGAARGTTASAAASRNYANALLVERQASIAAARAEDALAASLSKSALAKRAALGILGGPAGLAITIGMVASGWLLLRDNTDAAESALANWTGTADEAVEKFRELNSQQQAGVIVRMTEEIDAALGEVDGAVDRLAAKFQQLDPAAGRQIRELSGQFRDGSITADEFSAAVAKVNEESLSRTGLAGNQSAVNAVATLTAGLADAARAADSKRETLDQVNSVNRETERQANASAGAIRGQAEAFALVAAAGESAGKRIQSGLLSLPGQIERVGKSAREVAQLDVRDWIMQQSNDLGITSADDPRYLELVEQGRQYVAMVTEQEAKQKALTESTRALAAARKQGREATAGDLYLERLNESYADQVISLERQIALHGELGRAAAMAYDLANGALSGLAQAQKDYLQESSEWLDFLDDMAALDQVWEEEAKRHAKYAEDAKKRLTGMSAYADQAARNMQTALGDNLYNVLDGKFDSIADSFGNMLKRMAAELMASEIWRALGTALAGATGDGWWGNFARSVGGAMQGNTAGGRAGGGAVRPFSAYDVTEHGDPELLTYGSRQVLLMGSKGGMVTPLMNRAGGGAGAGGPMRVEIVNSGPPVQAQRSEFRRGPGGEGLLRVFLSAVADDVASGGRTAAAMKGRFGLREAM